MNIRLCTSLYKLLTRGLILVNIQINQQISVPTKTHMNEMWMPLLIIGYILNRVVIFEPFILS